MGYPHNIYDRGRRLRRESRGHEHSHWRHLQQLWLGFFCDYDYDHGHDGLKHLLQGQLLQLHPFDDHAHHLQ